MSSTLSVGLHVISSEKTSRNTLVTVFTESVFFLLQVQPDAAMLETRIRQEADVLRHQQGTGKDDGEESGMLQRHTELNIKGGGTFSMDETWKKKLEKLFYFSSEFAQIRRWTDRCLWFLDASTKSDFKSGKTKNKHVYNRKSVILSKGFWMERNLDQRTGLSVTPSREKALLLAPPNPVHSVAFLRPPLVGARRHQ